jgi:peptidoglycan/LPS O-acetylase OafA/YrhL
MISRPAKDGRLFGLDLLRAGAVVMVMACHVPWAKGWLSIWKLRLSFLGQLGVECFFVLSGFLIGRMVLQAYRERPDWSSLGRHLRRRMGRILPLYYLAMLAHTLLALPGLPRGAWRHAVFAQNLVAPPSGFFAESWTLSVEVWFYLAFPLLLLVLLKVTRRMGLSLALSVGALVLLAMASRSFLAGGGRTGLLRGILLGHLDAPMLGVLGAWASMRLPRLWKGVAWPALVLAPVLISVWLLAPHEGTAARIFLPLAGSVGCLALLPALCRMKPAGGVAGRAVSGLARWSYALYLCQLPVLFLLNRTIFLWRWWHPEATLIMFVAAAVVTAGLLHGLVERPLAGLKRSASLGHERPGEAVALHHADGAGLPGHAQLHR